VRDMSEPKISVIMSVYNGKKYLGESISSILNQTFKEFELIIINDASSDGSLKIIKNFKKRDKRIKIINNKKNVGPAKARNLGLKIAEGKYIAILDSDDIPLPHRIEKQFDFLEKNKDIFLCGTNRIDIDEKGNIIRDKCTVIQGFDKIKKVLRKRNCITHSSVMFRNKGFTYREKFYYSHDYDFYLNLLSKGLKLDNLDKQLIKYRNAPDSITISKKIKQDLFAKKAIEFYKQRIKKGKDQYDEFDPAEILKIEDKNSKKIFFELKMKLHFKNGDFKNAKKTFLEYKKLKETSFFDTLPYFVCINFPFIYRLYRWVLYEIIYKI